MRSGVRIGVVIPALNEEQAIGQVIADIPDWVDEIVVADNGSSDRTIDIARRAGARVVTESDRGYGAACQAGLRALGPTDVIVFLDGDYSDDPREMAAIVDPILSDSVELVIGSRVTGNAAPGALSPHQRFGNWFACLLMQWLFATCFSDLGPFRAIRAGSLQRLQMRDRNYGWTVEMQIKAAQLGLAVQEVPVSYRPRIGVSKISGTFRGSFMAGVTILRVIARSVRVPAFATVSQNR